MHKVNVKNTEIETKAYSFTDDKGGERKGETRYQKAVIDCDAYRKPIRIKLGTREAYPVGEYQIDFEASTKFTDAGDLVAEKNIVLQPMKKAA